MRTDKRRTKIIDENMATIIYRQDGVVKHWGIGAHRERDNEESLREHLAHWHPDAEFLGFVWGSTGEGGEFHD